MPDTAEALEILSTLRSAEVPMALVHDEYGQFEGLVTPTDLTGAIVGGFRPNEDPGDEQAAVQREDGSWLLAGWMPADKMVDMLRLAIPSDRSYQTVAGFLLEAISACPRWVRQWRWMAGGSRSWTWTAAGSIRCSPRRSRQAPCWPPIGRGVVRPCGEQVSVPAVMVTP
jgi:hypothetical protein